MLSCSLLTIQDSAFAHVVDTHANLHSIAGKYSDVVHTYLATYGASYDAFIVGVP